MRCCGMAAAYDAHAWPSTVLSLNGARHLVGTFPPDMLRGMSKRSWSLTCTFPCMIVWVKPVSECLKGLMKRSITAKVIESAL
eukprot:scaffold5481_cov18-Tisochrysis_lutea.AAC.1